MPLLDKTEKRTKIAFPPNGPIDIIFQRYNEPAKLKIKNAIIEASCLRCTEPRCMRYLDSEISCDAVNDFSYERNLNVCPTDAIKWDYSKEAPVVDNQKCIKCGLCASRCPIGAIYIESGELKVKANNHKYQDEKISHGALEAHKKIIRDLTKRSWKHQFQKESEALLSNIYKDISRFDGRSLVPNLLVRNLIIALRYKCALSRSGDVYTRMDAVYANYSCKGAVEIEFGRDTLEASRGILDDIAVLHSRQQIPKEKNTALVVCLSLPNKRQGYFQVIKDINNVLGLKIQTLTLGALLVLVWNGVDIDFIDLDFYADFDNMSIRSALEKHLLRSLSLREGFLGILEPEK